MCLSTITEIHNPPKEEEIIGYKLFNVSKSGGLRGEYYNLSKSYKRGVWLKSSNKYINLFTTYDKKYKSGFHAYLNKNDAIGITQYLPHLKVVEVKLRKITAVGIQFFTNVVVGQEMFIPK